MTLNVVYGDGVGQPTRHVIINNIQYPVTKGSALSAMFYRVMHGGLVIDAETHRPTADKRGIVYYASPDAYWMAEYGSMDCDSEESCQKQEAMRIKFFKSQAVLDWKNRVEMIQADPTDWIRECRRRTAD